MVNLIFWPLIFAIISPFILGFVNILDKFVISNKVKSPIGFTIIAGIVTSTIGIIIAVFLNWKNVTITDLIFPTMAGIIFGFQYILYYLMLKKEDVANIIGWEYVYPIIVGILSFLFLNEVIPLISYIGMFFILSGATTISMKRGKIRFKVAIWSIVLFILITAFYEFFIKISTITLSAINGISVSCIFVGVVMLPGLLNKKIRKGFLREMKNLKWAILNESLTVLGIAFIFFAMAGLPATIVSSVAAIQPFAVLILEFSASKIGVKITTDTDFKKKAFSILLIVIGVVLLYLPELIKV